PTPRCRVVASTADSKLAHTSDYPEQLYLLWRPLPGATPYGEGKGAMSMLHTCSNCTPSFRAGYRPLSVQKTGVTSGETRPRSTHRPALSLRIRMRKQQVYSARSCQQAAQPQDGAQSLPERVHG